MPRPKVDDKQKLKHHYVVRLNDEMKKIVITNGGAKWIRQCIIKAARNLNKKVDKNQ